MAAWSGAEPLLVATLLHPLGADPNDAAAAFAENYESALAVRQIEVGLAALLGLVAGLTLTGFALALASAASPPAGWGLAGWWTRRAWSRPG